MSQHIVITFMSITPGLIEQSLFVALDYGRARWYGGGFLDAPPPARGFEQIRDGYRSRLAKVGLMRSPRKVDHAALLAAFRAHWCAVPELVPGLGLDEDPERSWLSAMVRNGRRAAPPLYHLMLEAVIDGLEEVPIDLPFGTESWPCRNPVSGHHGEPVIESVEIRRDRNVLYGDFACTCGYLYTIGRSADGNLGTPRYRHFGPTLMLALRGAVDRGDSLRATARILGLDTKTLMREAAIAGIEVP